MAFSLHSSSHPAPRFIVEIISWGWADGGLKKRQKQRQVGLSFSGDAGKKVN